MRSSGQCGTYDYDRLSPYKGQGWNAFRCYTFRTRVRMWNKKYGKRLELSEEEETEAA